MIYESYWIECHSPLNYCDDESLGWLTRMKRGIRKIMSYLPERSTWTFDGFGGRGQNDDWIECNCIEEFEADSLAKAKEVIQEEGLYAEDTGVFNCYEKGNYTDPAFTEEDL